MYDAVCQNCFNETYEKLLSKCIVSGEDCLINPIKIYNPLEPCILCLDKSISKNEPGYVNECGHWLCVDCFMFVSNQKSAKCPMFLCDKKINQREINHVGGMQIMVKLISGKTIVLRVNPDSMTVDELKELIKFKTSNMGGFDIEAHSTNLFRLVCNGKPLNPWMLLGQCNLTKDITIRSYEKFNGIEFGEEYLDYSTSTPIYHPNDEIAT